LVVHDVNLDLDALGQFCQKWNIRQLFVFGSILRADFRRDSDVDFLVDFEPCPEVDGYDLFDEIHMREELSGIVGRDVDLVDRAVLESSSNPFFKRDVLARAEPIFAKR
jgi:predicted nucleotidyltransferase